MKIARRMARLERIVGPAECPGDFGWVIFFVEEGAEPVVPDDICKRCGKPVSEHSAAQSCHITQIIAGVPEEAFAG